MNKIKGIIVSGYFNPLHKGHLELFKKAKEFGDQLFVIVNNDSQRALKGSVEFMKQDERILIINALEITDKTFLSIDKDRSVSATIEQIYMSLGNEYELYFANGGDQNNSIILESNICRKLGIKLIEGLGGKIQSSSWLLEK